MARSRVLALVFVAAVAALALSGEAQRKAPSIAFGGAQVSLGMTPEQVEENLADASRHIEFLKGDKHTALGTGSV
ncbi:MAG: hypothetical protein WCA16_12960 [Candidatus Sulfotelmatobacter sp.]